jgi:hypothetical protein
VRRPCRVNSALAQRTERPRRDGEYRLQQWDHPQRADPDDREPEEVVAREHQRRPNGQSGASRVITISAMTIAMARSRDGCNNNYVDKARPCRRDTGAHDEGGHLCG